MNQHEIKGAMSGTARHCEDFSFGEAASVFKVGRKMFVAYRFDGWPLRPVRARSPVAGHVSGNRVRI